MSRKGIQCTIFGPRKLNYFSLHSYPPGKKKLMVGKPEDDYFYEKNSKKNNLV